MLRLQHMAAAANEQRAQDLRRILAASGSVTFIKSGQALSLRGDLIKNREYVRELEKLQVSKRAHMKCFCVPYCLLQLASSGCGY